MTMGVTTRRARASATLALGVAAWLVARPTQAATHYLATNGADSGPGSEAQPWQTFAHAVASMSGGDTLLVNDGVYAEVVSNPPSGSAAAYTTIKAIHPGRVLVDGASIPEDNAALMLNGVEYITIEGMKFRTDPSRSNINPAQILYSANHIKLLRCAFYDTPDHGNHAVLVIGPNAQDILVEECWVWGPGRYKFLNYQSQRVIFRRCVSRHDFYDLNAPAADNQTATFTMYDSTDFLVQNCIAIDSGNDDETLTGRYYGGLWLENNDLRDTTGKVQGSIFLNLRTLAAINDPKLFGERVIENSVIWDSTGGYGVYDYGADASVVSTSLLDHMTLGMLVGTYADSSHAWGTGAQAAASMEGVLTRNSIITGANSFGIADYMTSDWNLLYGNAKDYGSGLDAVNPSPGAHDATGDPGLLYIVRVESGSPAKGTASDGGDRGANVLQRYGVSGSLWGEPGFDQLTNEPLWPFPNEQDIKQDMSTYVPRRAEPSGQRGFCVPGNGLYGGPITLTSYIWEYLGNRCPDDICPGGSPAGSTGTGGTGAATGLSSSSSTRAHSGCSCYQAAQPVGRTDRWSWLGVVVLGLMRRRWRDRWSRP